MADDQKLIKEISKYSDQIGGFAGKYSSYNKFFRTDFVASCDGVGTKILLAQIARSYFSRPLQSIGIDCVAMVVNDLLCKGAMPRFFLDYFAADSLREHEFYEVLAGIQDGCEECEMELLGGETAELNGLISYGTFDVCGFGVGNIADGQELPKDNIKIGDSVVGLESSGFHSNGFTIIRQHTTKDRFNDTRQVPPVDFEWLSFLLEPTKIYVNDILKIREIGSGMWNEEEEIEIKALAHITGGGFKNVDRVLPNNLKVKYEREDVFYSHHQLFQWIQTKAEMTMEEMRNTFNCGIGMVMILSPEDAKRLPVDTIPLGRIDNNYED